MVMRKEANCTSAWYGSCKEKAIAKDWLLMIDAQRKMSNEKILSNLIPSLLIICGIISQTSLSTASFIFVEQKEAIIGEVFSINITCIPSEPVKAFEFKIRYPSFLSLVSVNTGNFFTGFVTFQATGIHDIKTCSIKNVYGLIMGHGNVSFPGILIVLCFHADKEGNGNISLYDAGITNEKQYLSLTVVNGTLLVYQKKIVAETKNNEGKINNLPGQILVIGFSVFILIAIFKRLRKP
jgi:hypothetical protein